MGGGERAISQQPGVENRGFHPFRAGHHSVLDVPGDDGRHVHERARPGVQDRPFLAVGSDIGQPYGPRKDIVEIGRFRIRNVDGVPLGEDAPGGECSTCSHGVFTYLNCLRAKTSSTWPARDSWTPSPPPETASGKMCRNSDASAILLHILRRSILCSVSSNRYPRWMARRTEASFFASYGWHQKNGRQHRGTCRCRLRGKGDGRGGYRSHVPSSSSLASRVSGKTSRRPMCFTSNFLFRAAKWRSP